MTTPTRAELEAQIAANDAANVRLRKQIAAMASVPNLEAWRPALCALYGDGGTTPALPFDETDIRYIGRLKAAFALAPLSPRGMGEDHALCHAEGCSLVNIPYQLASCGCLSRVPVAGWPGEDELEAMAREVAHYILDEGGRDYDAARLAAHEMARRLKARILLANPPPEPEWVIWHGGECPVPAGSEVETKQGNGYTAKGRAAIFDWERKGWHNDIIAYRILTDGEQGA